MGSSILSSSTEEDDLGTDSLLARWKLSFELSTYWLDLTSYAKALSYPPRMSVMAKLDAHAPLDPSHQIIQSLAIDYEPLDHKVTSHGLPSWQSVRGSLVFLL
ncbi:hypothetical protein Tco_0862590 [Tanacetum coccineum]